MNPYERYLFPAHDRLSPAAWVMSLKGALAHCAPAKGEVLEIGIGTVSICSFLAP